MASQSSAVEELNVKDFGFLLSCKLRVASPIDSSNQKFNHLAVANKYGIIVFVNKNELKYISVDTVDEFGSTKAHISEEGSEYPYGCMKLQGNISFIALNSDETVVFVVYKNLQKLVLVALSMNDLISESQVSQGFASVELSNDSTLLDLKCHPENSSMLALCLSNGMTAIYELQQNKFSITGSLNEGSAASICWSPKGKQIVVGKKSGDIVQYDKTLKVVKKTTPHGSSIESEVIRAAAVHWISSYEFFVVYDADDKITPPECMIVKTQKDGPASYSSLQDIFYGFSEDRMLYYYLTYLPEWQIIISMASNAMESVPVGKAEGNWARWQLDDTNRAEIPLNSEKEDCYPVGMGICYNSKLDVIEGDKRSPPVPLFFVLSNDGVVCSYQLVNTFPDTPKQITRSLPKYIKFQKKHSSETLLEASSNIEKDKADVTKPNEFSFSNTNTQLFSLKTSESSFFNTLNNPSIQSSLSTTSAPKTAPVPSIAGAFSLTPTPKPQGEVSLGNQPNLFGTPVEAAKSIPKTSSLSKPTTVSSSFSTPLFGIKSSSQQPTTNSTPLFGMKPPLSQQSTANSTPLFGMKPPLSQQTSNSTSLFSSKPSSQPIATNTSTPLFGMKPSSQQAATGSLFPLSSSSQTPTKTLLFASSSNIKPYLSGSSNNNLVPTTQQNTVQGVSQSSVQGNPTQPSQSGVHQIYSPMSTSVTANPISSQVSKSSNTDLLESQEKLNKAIQKSIIEEIDSFNHEMDSFTQNFNDFFNWSENYTKSLDHIVLNKSVQDLKANVKSHQNIMSENIIECTELREKMLNMCNTVDETAVRKNKLDSSIYASTLKDRPLDPISKQQLKTVYNSMQYIETQLSDINDTLTTKMKSNIKQKFSGSKKNPLENINRTVDMINAITNQLSMSLHQLSLENMVHNASTNQSVMSKTQHDTAVNEKKKCMQPQKIRQIKQFLSNREKPRSKQPVSFNFTKENYTKKSPSSESKIFSNKDKKHLKSPQNRGSLSSSPFQTQSKQSVSVKAKNFVIPGSITPIPPSINLKGNKTSKVLSNNSVAMTTSLSSTGGFNVKSASNTTPNFARTFAPKDLPSKIQERKSDGSIQGNTQSFQLNSTPKEPSQQKSLFVKPVEKPFIGLSQNTNATSATVDSLNFGTKGSFLTKATDTKQTNETLSFSNLAMKNQANFPAKEPFSFGGSETKKEIPKSMQEPTFSFSLGKVSSENNKAAKPKDTLTFATPQKPIDNLEKTSQVKSLFNFTPSTKPTDKTEDEIENKGDGVFSFGSVKKASQVPKEFAQSKPTTFSFGGMQKKSLAVSESFSFASTQNQSVANDDEKDKTMTSSATPYRSTENTDDKKEGMKPPENVFLSSLKENNKEGETLKSNEGFSFGGFSSQPDNNTFTFATSAKQLEQKPAENTESGALSQKTSAEDSSVVKPFGDQLFAPKQTLTFDLPKTENEIKKPLVFQSQNVAKSSENSVVFGSQSVSTTVGTPSFSTSIFGSLDISSSTTTTTTTTTSSFPPAAPPIATFTQSLSFGFSTPNEKQNSGGLKFGGESNASKSTATNPMFQTNPSIFSGGGNSIFKSDVNQNDEKNKDETVNAGISKSGVLGASTFGFNLNQKKENESSGLFSKGFGFGMSNNSTSQSDSLSQPTNTAFGGTPAFGATTPAFGNTASAFGGAAPAFGGNPTFGAAPTFGSPPAFGSAPAFGSPPTFGSSSTFGGMGNAQNQTPFGASSGGNLPTFGSLSQNPSVFGSGGNASNAPSFQSLASQGGTNAGSGGGMFGSNNNNNNNAFGSSSNDSGGFSMSGSSFTSWR